jgi:PAS domain S-box-containing protein
MRILLVEDNLDHRELMSLALSGHDPNWQVNEVESGEEALCRLAEGEAYDLVFLDYSLPGRDGLEVLKGIRRGEAPPPVVMVTGRGDEQVAVEAMKGGAYDYVTKVEGYLQRLPVVAQRAVEVYRLAAERKRAEEVLRESEERFRMVLESSLDNLYRRDLETDTYDYMSPAVERISGYSVEEMLSMPFESVVSMMHPDDIDRVKRVIGESMTSDRASHLLEYRFRHKDGQYRWLSDLFTVVKDAQGRPLYFLGNVRDITDRKRAEEALRRSKREWESTFDAMADWVSLVDLKGRVLRTNRVGEEVVGVALADMVGQSICKLVHGSEEPIPGCPLQKVLHTHQRGVAELQVPGDDRWLMVTVDPVMDDDGSLVRAVHIVRDITDRKRAEEALRESEESYRELADSITDVFFAMDKDLRYTYWNKASESLTGIRAEDALGKSLLEVFPDTPWVRRAEKVYRDVLRTQQSQAFVNDTDLGGRHYVFEISAYPSRNGISVFVKDITDRKRAQEALQESEERLRGLFETMAEGIVLIAPDGQIIQANTAAEHILGLQRSEIEARNYVSPEWKTLRPDGTPMPPEEMAGPRAMKEKRLVKDVVMGVKRPDDSISWINVSAAPLMDEAGRFEGVVGTFADITERKRAEEALKMQARVLESMVEGVNVSDENGVISFTNSAFDAMFGYERGELIGKHVSILNAYSPEENARFVGEVMEKLKAQGAWFGEVSNRKKDGTPFTTSTHVSTLEVPGKQYWVAVQEDITERRRAEEEINRLFEETQQRAVEMTSLYTTSLLLATAGELNELLQTVVHQAVTLLQATGGGLYYYDQAADELEWVVAYGAGEENIGTRLKPGEGLSGKVMQERRPLVVGDYRTWEGRSLKYEGQPFTAVAAVPLLWQDQLIGVLDVVDDRERRTFDDDDVHLLTMLAQQAAATIANARSLQAEQKRAEQLAVVNELGRSLAATLDLLTVYHTAHQHVQHLVDCPNFAISLFDPQQQVLTMAFCLSDGVELDLALFPPLPYDPQARAGRSKAIATGQPTFVQDLPTAARACGKGCLIGDGPEPLSALYVPMIVEGQVIGLVEMQSYRPQAYRQEDIELLSPVANQIGLAIQNARLYEAEHTQRKLAEALRDTAETLNSTLDLNEVLDRILANAGRMALYDAGDILMLDSDGMVSIARSRGYAERGLEEWVKARRFPLADFRSLREIVERGQPLAIPDTQAYDGWVDVPETRWIRSYICAPIRVKGQIVGFISLSSTTPGTYTSAHAQRLQTFANQSAIAIENARLFEEVLAGQERMRMLTQQLVSTQEEERKRIARELHDELGQALTAITFDLAAIQKQLPPKGP